MSDIPAPGRILTGANPTGQTARFSFRAPSDFWIVAVINGIFNTLVNSEAWTQGVGGISAEDAASIFNKVVWTVSMSTDVGQILSFATISLPAYCLPCNGASYLRTDYPELFAAIGVLWGSVDSTHFNVPNFDHDVLGSPGDYGSGALTVGASVGELTHTLTTSEMPAHSHAVEQFIPTAAGLEATLASLDSGLPISSTGSAGGSGAHNNIQPTKIVNWGIVYTDER